MFRRFFIPCTSDSAPRVSGSLSRRGGTLIDPHGSYTPHPVAPGMTRGIAQRYQLATLAVLMSYILTVFTPAAFGQPDPDVKDCLEDRRLSIHCLGGAVPEPHQWFVDAARSSFVLHSVRLTKVQRATVTMGDETQSRPWNGAVCIPPAVAEELPMSFNKAYTVVSTIKSSALSGRLRSRPAAELAAMVNTALGTHIDVDSAGNGRLEKVTPPPVSMMVGICRSKKRIATCSIMSVTASAEVLGYFQARYTCDGGLTYHIESIRCHLGSAQSVGSHFSDAATTTVNGILAVCYRCQSD